MSDTQSTILTNPPKRKRPRIASVRAKKTNIPEIGALELAYNLSEPGVVKLSDLKKIKYILISNATPERTDDNIGFPLLIPGDTIEEFTEESISPHHFICKFKKESLLNNHLFKDIESHSVNVSIIYDVTDAPSDQSEWVDSFSSIHYYHPA